MGAARCRIRHHRVVHVVDVNRAAGGQNLLALDTLTRLPRSTDATPPLMRWVRFVARTDVRAEVAGGGEADLVATRSTTMSACSSRAGRRRGARVAGSAHVGTAGPAGGDRFVAGLAGVPAGAGRTHFVSTSPRAVVESFIPVGQDEAAAATRARFARPVTVRSLSSTRMGTRRLRRRVHLRLLERPTYRPDPGPLRSARRHPGGGRLQPSERGHRRRGGVTSTSTIPGSGPRSPGVEAVRKQFPGASPGSVPRMGGLKRRVSGRAPHSQRRRRPQRRRPPAG